MSEEITSLMLSNGPRIERDGTSIILYGSENTYIKIDKDKIEIKGNIIINGTLKVNSGASGMACGTSITIIKDGQVIGVA